MSDLAEIRSLISAIERSTATTAEAVSWIKAGMNEHNRRLDAHMADDVRRLDEHDVRLNKVENRQHWYSGAAAVVGAIGTAFAEHFFGAHT